MFAGSYLNYDCYLLVLTNPRLWIHYFDHCWILDNIRSTRNESLRHLHSLYTTLCDCDLCHNGCCPMQQVLSIRGLFIASH